MRNPARLWRELGWRSFLAFHILFTGMIASALVHPVFLATLIWITLRALFEGHLDATGMRLLVFDTVSLASGYFAFLLLAYRSMLPHQRTGFAKAALFTPIYWFAMSIAAWRALFQLIANPYRWEKTPHWPRRTPPRSAQREK